MSNTVEMLNDGNDINLYVRGIHSKNAVLAMAIAQGIIDPDDEFSGEAESGWWVSVRFRGKVVEFQQATESSTGAFQATFVSKWG